MPFGVVNRIEESEEVIERPRPRRQRVEVAPILPPPPIQQDEINVNEFILWVLRINSRDYPVGGAIIRRAQKYKRTSFIKDVLDLYKVYKEEGTNT